MGCVSSANSYCAEVRRGSSSTNGREDCGGSTGPDRRENCTGASSRHYGNDCTSSCDLNASTSHGRSCHCRDIRTSTHHVCPIDGICNANDDNGCTNAHGGLHLCTIANDDHGRTNDNYGCPCDGHRLRPLTNDLVGEHRAVI